jgi:hypothetical protein
MFMFMFTYMFTYMDNDKDSIHKKLWIIIVDPSNQIYPRYQILPINFPRGPILQGRNSQWILYLSKYISIGYQRPGKTF